MEDSEYNKKRLLILNETLFLVTNIEVLQFVEQISNVNKKHQTAEHCQRSLNTVFNRICMIEWSHTFFYGMTSPIPGLQHDRCFWIVFVIAYFLAEQPRVNNKAVEKFDDFIICCTNQRSKSVLVEWTAKKSTCNHNGWQKKFQMVSQANRTRNDVR